MMQYQIGKRNSLSKRCVRPGAVRPRVIGSRVHLQRGTPPKRNIGTPGMFRSGESAAPKSLTPILGDRSSRRLACRFFPERERGAGSRHMYRARHAKRVCVESSVRDHRLCGAGARQRRGRLGV